MSEIPLIRASSRLIAVEGRANSKAGLREAERKATRTGKAIDREQRRFAQRPCPFLRPAMPLE
jgi:hypothetical protein